MARPKGGGLFTVLAGAFGVLAMQTWLPIMARERQTTAEPKDASSGGGEPAEPFIRNARRHDEQAFTVATAAIGAAQQTVGGGPRDIPAIGFLRRVYVDVNATGGVNGAAAVAVTADAPWNAVNRVQLLDITGQANIDLSGYGWFLVNLFGGYHFSGLATAWPNYVTPVIGAAPATGNFRFQLWLPVEMMADGYCALPNENAASTLKTRMIIDTTATIYTVAPDTTLPTPTITAQEYVWTRPLRGTPEPPGVGSTAYWNSVIYNTVTGINTIRLAQVGQWIHTLILVWRTAAGARYAVGAVADFRLRLDGVDLLGPKPIAAQDTETFMAFGYAPPVGVTVVSFRDDMDGHPATDDTAELWLPTSAATRLEIVATLPAGGAAGTLEVITGYVVPIGGIPYPFQPPY
jgi:hypothetical protein